MCLFAVWGTLFVLFLDWLIDWLIGVLVCPWLDGWMVGWLIELLFSDADDTFSIAFWLTVTMFSNLFYHNDMKLNIISELDNITDYLFRKLQT